VRDFVSGAYTFTGCTVGRAILGAAWSSAEAMAAFVSVHYSEHSPPPFVASLFDDEDDEVITH
jgi:hypothetical protein